MNADIFENVKAALASRIPEVVETLIPGGKIAGKEYICASLEGGQGKSCRTNLASGVGSDFATGETWSDIIDLAAKVWKMRPYEAALELATQYGIEHSRVFPTGVGKKSKSSLDFMPILPVPKNAPAPMRRHPQYGSCTYLWHYFNAANELIFCTARFELPNGKVVLPQCYGRIGKSHKQWCWKSLPDNRPLYGLQKLHSEQPKPVLLVEGEKTADAAQTLLPEYAVLTWSGGSNAMAKSDFSPLYGRSIVIWPDNDKPGLEAVAFVCEMLAKKTDTIRIVLPSPTLPTGWDLADAIPQDMDIQQSLRNSLAPAAFLREYRNRFQKIEAQSRPSGKEESGINTAPLPHGGGKGQSQPADNEEFDIKEWPKFSYEACPGILGDFVALATRDSEADPAAVCITALVRFCAEVYGIGANKGPHILVGETAHPPRLFAVICGNSSKARKGTSRYPVAKLFGRALCEPSYLRELRLPVPARESGGPLSTGEGLAYHVRELSDAEMERLQKQNPEMDIRDKGDKRLIIMDEEFANGLACTKREGNTLSMGIRCFWDSGDYSPLTKSNPITVKGAHINIVTHITMQELSVCLAEVQAFNGFGNRFLWICARRSKLVALPSPMPHNDLAPIQRELWRIIAHAQNCGNVVMSASCLDYWKTIYPEISREHTGLVGSIINRAEAQTIRLALAYALLDGKQCINEPHLRAALAMWKYAEASARYIFGDKTIDPLEAKIMEALKNGPLTATELSALLCRNIPKERLQPLLQQMEARQVITVRKQKGCGRPRQIIALNTQSTTNEINEKNELSEQALE